MKLSFMTLQKLFSVLGGGAMMLQTENVTDDVVQRYNNMLQDIHNAGYQYVDVSDMEVRLFGAEQLKTMLAAQELQVACVLLFDTYPLTENMAKKIQHARDTIDQTKAVGAGLVMLIPSAQEIGKFNTDTPVPSRQAMTETMAACWAEIAAYGQSQGVTCVIEDTPNLQIPLDTVEEMEDMFQRVPELRMLYDTGNMLLVDADPVTYLQAFIDKTVHLHLKDMEYVSLDQPGDINLHGQKMNSTYHGTGLIPFPEIFAVLRSCGYQGFMTVECNERDVSASDWVERIRSIREYFLSLGASR